MSPRFDITLGSMEKWLNALMPSRQFGHMVLTTSYGIMDHEEARRKKTGGKIIGQKLFSFPRWRALFGTNTTFLQHYTTTQHNNSTTTHVYMSRTQSLSHFTFTSRRILLLIFWGDWTCSKTHLDFALPTGVKLSGFVCCWKLVHIH